MYNNIELEDYRGFKKYQLSGLGQVNLLVGKNNSGKTSILEAVNLLAAAGDPRVLTRIAWYRGEMETISLGSDDSVDLFPNILHFFHGHERREDMCLSINSDDITLYFRLLNVSEIEESQQQFLFEEIARSRRPNLRAEAANLRIVSALRIEGDKVPGGSASLPVSEEGALIVESSRYNRLTTRWRREEIGSVQFITADSLDQSAMSVMWDKIIMEGREKEVIDVMKILEPTLNNIFFLSSERAIRYGRGGILASFEYDGAPKRFPLGSYGEGMRRLLALSLSIIRAKGGVLLIDEVDTGLHYSIMGDMWLMLLKSAIQNGVQVFATTHSLDCVRGLAWLCENQPKLASHVTLQKIDRLIDEAVRLDASKIKIAVEQDTEVR